MSSPSGLPTKPLALRDLVAYQEGAIVSRVLLRTEHGSVTLFAFDAGEHLSEHTTPYDALWYGLEGESWVTIDRQRHRVRAGEVLRLPAQVVHAVEARKRFKALLVMLRA